MGNTLSHDSSAVQSVDRALSVLSLIAEHGEIGVTELSLALGVHKSTVSRLVSSLVDHDLVEQVSQRGRFKLGFGVVRLAGLVTSKLPVVEGTRQITRALASQIGETINIAVLDGNRVLYVDQVAGTNIMTMRSWIGQSVMTHVTATGKALTAWLDDEARKAARPEKWERYTENTITSADDLERELEITRERGYAVANEELEAGLVAIAAPIRNTHNEVVACLSASGPAYRIVPDMIPAIATHVIFSANQLSGKSDYS